jgi:hypothetical protein
MIDTPEEKRVSPRLGHICGLSRPVFTAALLFGIAAGLIIACLDMPAKLWGALLVGALAGVAIPIMSRYWP